MGGFGFGRDLVNIAVLSHQITRKLAQAAQVGRRLAVSRLSRLEALSAVTKFWSRRAHFVPTRTPSVAPSDTKTPGLAGD